MQKIFQNCYAMDRRCYEVYGLTEDILMEHAAGGIASYIRGEFPDGSRILIIAGIGNNGADGIVLARLLYMRYEITLVTPFGVKSHMAKLQLERVQKLGVVVGKEIDEQYDQMDVVVDALFGAGLDRELDRESRSLIERMNQLDGFKIACDIPSGIGADGRVLPLAFRADTTITMGAHKEALYLDEAKDFVGEIISVDLGVDRMLYEEESDTFVLDIDDMHLPSRTIQSTNKGSFGHATILSGEKEGASIMSGLAALRFGAGLATLVIHEKVSAPHCLMTSTVVPAGTTALAVGMGLGSSFDSEFIQRYILQSDLPLLLDADSFYSHELLSALEEKRRTIVLTPHPKEFASLWKITAGEEVTISQIQKNRFSFVRAFSQRYPSVVLLLKGANMLISYQNRVWINPLGSNKLSKGGSGDILSGLIVSLLAQGYDAVDAAIGGSLALALAAKSYEGASFAMLPTDLIDEIERLEKRISS
ncbi:MAG: NAD(P)H-hydrate dehydratase [Campylobacterota bacterium]|nr:NAD(P)H-hydrate dehydratase [Campylobacterota bacterium]